MCIIYPPNLLPVDTLLIDCKKSKHTRSLIYKNNIDKYDSEILMGFFINGEIINIKTSYIESHYTYYNLIKSEFFRLGYTKLETDSIENYKTFENNDFIVKSVNIENAEKYLNEMILELNLSPHNVQRFNLSFMQIIKNYKETFYNKKTFSDLNLVLAKFKDFKNKAKNTIEIIYEIAQDKLIVIPTAHELSDESCYSYDVYGYVDNVKNIDINQFKYFSDGNPYYDSKIESKTENQHSYLFSIKSTKLYLRNEKYNLPLNMKAEFINGFSKNNNKFYLKLDNYKNINNFNFYLESL